MRAHRCTDRSLCIVVGAMKVQGDIGLIAEHPGVVRLCWNVEQIAGAHLQDTPVSKSCCRCTCNDHSNMLDMTARLTERAADVLGPAPAWLIRRAANGHPTQSNDLEAAERHLAHLVRLLEAFQ